jgi:hypothetical protein
MSPQTRVITAHRENLGDAVLEIERSDSQNRTPPTSKCTRTLNENPMANRIAKLVRYAKVEAVDSDNSPVIIAKVVENPTQILVGRLSATRKRSHSRVLTG